MLHKKKDVADLIEIIKLRCLCFYNLSRIRKAEQLLVVEQFDENMVTNKEHKILKEQD